MTPGTITDLHEQLKTMAANQQKQQDAAKATADQAAKATGRPPVTPPAAPAGG